MKEGQGIGPDAMMYRNDRRLEPATTPRVGDSRRFALKRATEAVHARVEGIITSAGMFDSLDGYRRYLSATLAIRTRYEGLLDGSGAATVWPAWPGRRVAHLVTQDLDDLGVVQPVLEKKAELALNPAELIGALYVLEGSSLGARVLSRSVHALGVSADHGARHLHAQAGDAGIWRDFLSVLDGAAVPPCHETAVRVFADFADAYVCAAR